MSLFTRYGRNDLSPADHIVLAAALTTLHLDGMKEPPLNSRWDDSWRNQYSIEFIPQTPVVLIINASEGMRDGRDRFKIFSLNTYSQAVTWETGTQASNVTPVPQHLHAFFRKLTKTVHEIAPKRAAALEAKRKWEEKARKYHEASKTKSAIEWEKERKEEAAEQKRKQKVLRRRDELNLLRNRRQIEKVREKEEEEKRKEKAADELEREIVRRMDELGQERKKRKREIERKKKAADELKRKILGREGELNREIARRRIDEWAERTEKGTEKTSDRQDGFDHAFLVMKWKASATELQSAANEKPTVADRIMEAAKRGRNHDLCETCGETLRFCCQCHECTIIGCVICFKEEFTGCEYCDGFVCLWHRNLCSNCDFFVCNGCGGRTCGCKTFVCTACIKREVDECGGCGLPLDEDFYGRYFGSPSGKCTDLT